MVDPFVFVIFGATGDLFLKKIAPALFTLFKKGEFPDDFYIYGFSRRDFTDESFRDFIDEGIKISVDDKFVWEQFVKHIFFQTGFFSEDVGYISLEEKLVALDVMSETPLLRLFYLATAPEFYEEIIDQIKNQKLDTEHMHIAIEKPFGKDLQSSKDLDKKLDDYFTEDQIFRVDHYLAKETVQNMLVFRFGNSIFEPVWDYQFLDHIQITWMETKGIDGRSIFDGVGLLRDVGQNHLMQLYAAVAMDQPKSFAKEDVRDARAKAIHAVRSPNADEVSKNIVRGQYVGYQNEPNVAEKSMTETFVAMKFFTDMPRLVGIPIYLRAGKGMKEDHVSISLVFRQTCHILFKEIGCPEEGNVLTFHIQPDEGITLKTIVKTPGTKLGLEPINLSFSYKNEFGHHGSDAYEKILVDIFNGDQMLFGRSDELKSSWEFIEKILEGWSNQDPESLKVYEKGSLGPKEAEKLIEKDGRHWI